ncbi:MULTISPECIES: hypothetical protein [unclassified Pseudoalteromonas]|jgi:hypothetical protein|uniref:hypothetical protein n=1 Tax=unclassified Pseudoalteromonas TaxID=194690 RepID=UPI000B6BF63D|nr:MULTISPECIES: hypothetical protein [unclassified Pseudoalteromonas]MAJ41139.1 hypothetical protein [Pseudoalteromonadaceae bacterium]OUX83910.1 MAG: hypothetical protein CBC03_14515 [Pseudoalteromonas sp. TMED43]MDC9563547.1 hypothetical protein [Pseudoalteromonas sp. GAB2316C]MDC9568106.1 hypothetical protein [Pseudoalteromonas sp. GABNB9D]MDC9572367.1 hypothetical protein [Pseudoalteromonas sp. GABNS16A]|tara:strand:+ start:278 stop:493 length:216 start_codon:yes stop_codon:yes gene_type:complete
MKTEIRYRFETSQVANRFVHVLKDWPVNQVKTRLFNGGDSVKVTYKYDESGFDYTSAELDDLAEQHGGKEV